MKPLHFTLLGWILFLFGLVLINKTKTGHTLIFYSLLLILVFLLVGNYRRIMSVIIKPETTTIIQ